MGLTLQLKSKTLTLRIQSRVSTVRLKSKTSTVRLKLKSSTMIDEGRDHVIGELAEFGYDAFACPHN